MRFLYLKSANIQKQAQIIYEIFSAVIMINDYELTEDDMIIFFDNEYNENIKEVTLSMLNDFYGEIKIYESAYYKTKQEAFISLDFIRKQIDTYGKKYQYIDNKIILLNNMNNKNKVVRKLILSNFYHDKDMLNLIKVYIENNQNTIETAKKLFLHRNTLNQKIDKFYLRTGFNIKVFNDAFLIYHLFII